MGAGTGEEGQVGAGAGEEGQGEEGERQGEEGEGQGEELVCPLETQKCHPWTCTQEFTYIHVYIQPYIHAYTCIHTYNIHTCTDTCIHTYIHTYIHQYIHVLTLKNTSSTNRRPSQQTERRESNKINEEYHSSNIPGIHQSLNKRNAAHLPIVAEGDRSHKQLRIKVIQIGVGQDSSLTLFHERRWIVLGRKLRSFEGSGEYPDPEDKQGGDEGSHDDQPSDKLKDTGCVRVSGPEGAVERQTAKIQIVC